MKRTWQPQAIAIAMLLWAFYPGNPYGYYILLRWVCCGIFAYLAFQAYTEEDNRWMWVFGVIAAFYNPIIRVHLTRDLWEIINIVTIGISATSIYFLKPKQD
ncbi:MAG: hypothetical protein P8Y64_13735 [Gammaproteobacteria bacterium]